LCVFSHDLIQRPSQKKATTKNEKAMNNSGYVGSGAMNFHLRVQSEQPKKKICSNKTTWGVSLVWD